MSLINDVLRDLEARQGVSAHPLAGLSATAARSGRRRFPMLAGFVIVATGSVSAAGLADWLRDADHATGASGSTVTAPATVPATGASAPTVFRLAGVAAFSESRERLADLPTGRTTQRKIVAARVEPRLRIDRALDAPKTRISVVPKRQALVTETVDATPSKRSAAAMPTAPTQQQASDATDLSHEATEPSGAIVVVRRSTPMRARTVVDAAIAALNAGRVADAIVQLEAAIDTFPAQAPVYRALAQARSANGDTAGAIVALRTGVDAVEQPQSLALLLARQLIDAGRETDALELAQRFAANDAPAGEFAVLRAALFQRTGRDAEAVHAYRSLAGASNDAAHWVGLAISSERLGDAQVAQAAYRHALDATGLAPALSDYAGARLAVLTGATR